MLRGLGIILLTIGLGSQAFAQGCPPQLVYQLQMSGMHPALIAQRCSAGGMQGMNPQGMGMSPQGSMCATQFGVCPTMGFVGSGCICPTQMGPVQGIVR